MKYFEGSQGRGCSVEGTLSESIPTLGSTGSVSAGGATALVLSPESSTHNSTPHLPAARANIPVRQHQHTGLLLRVVLSFISGASQAPDTNRNFTAGICCRFVSSRFVSQPPQTRILGAKQVTVTQCSCNGCFGKCLAPGVTMCFSRGFPIKTQVPDKLWVHVKARNSEFKL